MGILWFSSKSDDTLLFPCSGVDLVEWAASGGRTTLTGAVDELERCI